MGTSKYRAKQEARREYIAEHGCLKGFNPNKLDGIYSRNTMKTYLERVSGFGKFCAELGAKRLSDLTEEMAVQYLHTLNEHRASAWTIATAASAINKALGWTICPSKLGLPPRRKKNIIRSRTPRSYDARTISAYRDQITLAMATGVRRMSVTAVCPCDFVRNETGLVVGVHVTEKGGRHRLAPVLNKYREALTAIVNNAITKNGEVTPLFSKYSTRIDNHRFRAGYAAALLHQLEDERTTGQPLFSGAFSLKEYCLLKGKDAKRKSRTAGHDTDLLGVISGALGHNRIAVVLDHYLYLY